MSKIVLLFSLILLVSCSKSTKIKKVDLEMGFYLQKSIKNEYEDGYFYSNQIKELIITTDRNSSPNLYNRIKTIYVTFEEIENVCNKRMLELEQLKINMFKQLNLKVKVNKTSACSEYNFSTVDLNSTTSEVDDFKKNKDVFYKENLKVINEMMSLYLKSHTISEKQIKIKEINIEEFSSYEELNKLVSNEINRMNLPIECFELVRYYYTSSLVSKKQFNESVESIDNWVSLFNYVSMFQVKILEAKAILYADLRSNFGGCNYDFNKIEVLVNGPDKVRVGEEFKLKIFNAALNTDDQPVVNTTGNIFIKDGIATVVNKFNKKGEQTISGTISYRLKTGEIKTQSWTKKIIVD